MNVREKLRYSFSSSLRYTISNWTSERTFPTLFVKPFSDWTSLYNTYILFVTFFRIGRQGITTLLSLWSPSAWKMRRLLYETFWEWTLFLTHFYSFCLFFILPNCRHHILADYLNPNNNQQNSSQTKINEIHAHSNTNLEEKKRHQQIGYCHKCHLDKTKSKQSK